LTLAESLFATGTAGPPGAAKLAAWGRAPKASASVAAAMNVAFPANALRERRRRSVLRIVFRRNNLSPLLLAGVPHADRLP
jgi:hypothetical protein